VTFLTLWLLVRTDIITGFVKMVCNKVILDVKSGDDLDIRHFVKVTLMIRHTPSHMNHNTTRHDTTRHDNNTRRVFKMFRSRRS
jgi:hypothetical protein